MFEKIGIVVLNWNGKEDTTKCLHSLEKISYPKIQIFLVDNGSTDDSVSFFRQNFPYCTLIETNKNLGYAGGNNLGISAAIESGCEKILILNNDTIVDPGIIDAFSQGFENYPDAGILGAKIYLMDDPKRLDHFGGNWNRKKLRFDYLGFHELDEKRWSLPQKIDYVCGAGIMVKRCVFEKIGFFDPRFFLFWEETDFCFQAKREGFSVMTCPDAKIWHRVSASFSGKNHSAYFFWRNQFLWIERNIRGIRKFFYLFKLIGKNWTKYRLAKIVRSLQCFFQWVLGKDTSRNRERISRINAILCGIHDYLLRRFGPGRSKNFINCL